MWGWKVTQILHIIHKHGCFEMKLECGGLWVMCSTKLHILFSLNILFYCVLMSLALRYWVFRSWGRVGTTIGGNKLEKFYDKNSAMDHFRSVYEEKTGNCWTSSSFTKYPNKFYPLEIDYGQVCESCLGFSPST